MRMKVTLIPRVLESLHPHLGWMSAELKCTPWILVKWLTLFIDRVFDTAEDLCLPPAVFVLVKALGRLKPRGGGGGAAGLGPCMRHPLASSPPSFER